jgi:hypothetical protein
MGRINKEERRMIKMLSQVAAFEEFKTQILPSLQQDIKAGLSAEEILKKYAHMAAARQITIAMTDADSGRALSAIKDLLDRTQGKPTERKEIKHQFSELKDEELDSLLESVLSEGEQEEEESTESVGPQ